jgi:two-component system, NarL family, nitrate/nitrite response regulator NarL
MRLVLCDDHLLLLEALSTALSGRGWSIEATATTPDDAVKAVELHEPDVLVTDVAFPAGNGLDVVRLVVDHHPRTKVVILTGLDSPDVVREALEIGVAGYTRKSHSIQAIGDVVERAGAGEVAIDTALLRQLAIRRTGTRSTARTLLGRLTPREQHVLELLIDGRNTAEIVARLRISDSTARTHVQSILSKLGVHSRLQAVALLHEEVAGRSERDEVKPPPDSARLVAVGRPAALRVSGV